MSTDPMKPVWARDLPDATLDGEPIAYGPRPLSPRLLAVVVERPAREEAVPTLLAVFSNGEARRLDLALLTKAAPFAPLRNTSEASRLVVMPYGHGVEWACGADLPADYLYQEGHPVDAAVAVPDAATAAG